MWEELGVGSSEAGGTAPRGELSRLPQPGQRSHAPQTAVTQARNAQTTPLPWDRAARLPAQAEGQIIVEGAV